MKGALRYPGGKTRAIDRILPHISLDFYEYREPFVGGGSVFIALKQRVGDDVLFRINDLNYDLYCYWKMLKEERDALIDEITRIKREEPDGRTLFVKYTVDGWEGNDLERAVRFFILNRITFSGTVDSGGYSQNAFERRFTDSSIVRLKQLSSLLQHVLITHGDYETLLFEAGNDVFIFLDPPYFRQRKSRLYGKNGYLHVSFDHERFAQDMRRCPHKWLLTYDDSVEIRELYDFAYIYEWELQYGMNNYKQESAKKGSELFISNYPLKMSRQPKYIQKTLVVVD